MKQASIYLAQQETSYQEQDIDERIDIKSACFHHKPITTPLYNPDLLKYFYMAQLFRARNKSNMGNKLRDQLFKESCYDD